MGVFLIQVSGDESRHDETESDEWWQEPLEEGVYINYGWQRGGREQTWNNIREGDKVIVYCTGSVSDYPKQVSHIFTVDDVDITDERALMRLRDKRELPTGMPYDVIREKVDKKELSEGIGKCGNQGFNIGQVVESDLDTIFEWAANARSTIEISREADLQRFFMNNPEKIEEGLELVNSSDLLPEGAGIPDLVCRDSEGRYVVVELKSGEAKHDALGQLVSYKGAMREQIGEPVRGILIASNFEHKILFGAQLTDSEEQPLVEFKNYSLEFETRDVQQCLHNFGNKQIRQVISSVKFGTSKTVF